MVVAVQKTDHFLSAYRKFKDAGFRERIDKQMEKIIADPEIGKPMRFERKCTREVYISPYRLAYAYFPEDGKIVFLDLYHKNEQ